MGMLSSWGMGGRYCLNKHLSDHLCTRNAVFMIPRSVAPKMKKQRL